MSFAIFRDLGFSGESQYILEVGGVGVGASCSTSAIVGCFLCFYLLDSRSRNSDSTVVFR